MLKGSLAFQSAIVRARHCKMHPRREQCSLLQVLFPTCGSAYPGECLAILGPSGAGKSTALDILSLRKTSGKIVGEVCPPLICRRACICTSDTTDRSRKSGPCWCHRLAGIASSQASLVHTWVMTAHLTGPIPHLAPEVTHMRLSPAL